MSVGRNRAEPDSAVPLADLSSLWLRAIRFYFAFPSSELDKGLGRQCQVLGLHRRNLPASEGLGVRLPPACPHQPLLTPPRQPPARTPRVHSAPRPRPSPLLSAFSQTGAEDAGDARGLLPGTPQCVSGLPRSIWSTFFVNSTRTVSFAIVNHFTLQLKHFSSAVNRIQD